MGKCACLGNGQLLPMAGWLPIDGVVLFSCLLFHSFEEFLLQLFGELVVGIEFQGFLIVLHHVNVVALTVLGGILYDAYHVEETAKSTDI